ncbi:hypothetical protein HUJ05_010591 [Dendroctonus ponderosae]|nr:hypothetical protein HUJ05_010591 [Dendroctonus ponderosae]
MTLNSSSGFHRSYFVLNVQLSNHNINGLFCVNSSLLSAPAVMALFKVQETHQLHVGHRSKTCLASNSIENAHIDKTLSAIK